MFETASFHIVKPCNMNCKFCYATFHDMRLSKQLEREQVYLILDKLKDAGLQKITFAGGEPLLYRWICDVISYAKTIGMTTSIISNGSFVDEDFLVRMLGKLDWIGISIDSLNKETNRLIGRSFRNPMNYPKLISDIKYHGYKIKINTVVNRYNQEEDMNEFINWANPDRWKIFDTLRVEGQNDREFEEIRSIGNGFERFVKRHSHSSMVPENNTAMIGSYLLIDPQGRLFENSKGKHTYSGSLLNNDISQCLSEISLDRTMFIERGGIYDW